MRAVLCRYRAGFLCFRNDLPLNWVSANTEEVMVGCSTVGAIIPSRVGSGEMPLHKLVTSHSVAEIHNHDSVVV